MREYDEISSSFRHGDFTIISLSTKVAAVHYNRSCSHSDSTLPLIHSFDALLLSPHESLASTHKPASTQGLNTFNGKKSSKFSFSWMRVPFQFFTLVKQTRQNPLTFSFCVYTFHFPFSFSFTKKIIQSSPGTTNDMKTKKLKYWKTRKRMKATTKHEKYKWNFVQVDFFLVSTTAKFWCNINHCRKDRHERSVFRNVKHETETRHCSKGACERWERNSSARWWFFCFHSSRYKRRTRQEMSERKQRRKTPENIFQDFFFYS